MHREQWPPPVSNDIIMTVLALQGWKTQRVIFLIPCIPPPRSPEAPREEFKIWPPEKERTCLKVENSGFSPTSGYQAIQKLLGTGLARASHCPVWEQWLEASRLTRARWGLSHQKLLPPGVLFAERWNHTDDSSAPLAWSLTTGHCPSWNKARTRGVLLHLNSLVVSVKLLSARTSISWSSR